MVAASLIGTIAFGQVPDAGSLRQQLERERELKLPGRQVPAQRAEPPTLQSIATTTVTVKEFRFAGNTLIASAQLASVVSGFLNRPLGFNDLQSVATAIAQAYRDAGWTVRTYLPRQDVTEGVITIQIVEAVFGGAHTEGASPTRFKSETVLRMIEAAQPIGELLNAEKLDRAQLLADDIPGVAVAGMFVKGARDGETDLVLKLLDEPLLTGDISGANTGSRSSGSQSLAANLTLASPFGYGDQIAASLSHTEGSDYLRLGFTLPVGLDGWRVGASTSLMSYKLIAPEFEALDSKGSSTTSGLEASYPIIRNRMNNLYLALGYDRKNFDNQAGSSVTSHYQIDALTVGLTANVFDNLGGGGASSASLNYTDGSVDLEGSPNKVSDSITTNTAGHYGKLRWSLSRQQTLTDQLSFTALFSGQVAGKNLDSGEKFYLGGSSGVRAYPGSEGGGSEGQMLNLELRYRLSDVVTVGGLFDYGQVTVNKTNDYPGAPELNNITLKGAGLTLAWQAPAGINVKATLARRIGDNPNPTLTGNDQDGSLIANRFWLTVSAPF